MSDTLSFYAAPAHTSDFGDLADRVVKELPKDVSALVPALQNMSVHIFWAQARGIELSSARVLDLELRTAREKLDRVVQLTGTAPLGAAHASTDDLVVCNCRDYSLLAAAVLRAHGVPARARCGFSTYFNPGRFEDHWIAEVWEAGRWRRFDPQIDAMMREKVPQLAAFDYFDMPVARNSSEQPFVTGGEAWLLCRRNGFDPQRFGICGFGGIEFVRGNLFRDALALAKIEILPWDQWFAAGPGVSFLTKEQLEHLDHIAEICVEAQTSPDAVAKLCELAKTDPFLQIPPYWR